MAVEVRKSRVSADWVRPPEKEGYPLHFVTTWRVFLDGRMVDSFQSKARAEKKARLLRKSASR